jgi:hypothetical protein
MFLRRRVTAFAVLTAALAVGAPVAAAGGATSSADPVITGPSCPDDYRGPTNLATGCPSSLMTYTEQYPGQPPSRCPAGWSPPPASQDAAPGSPQHVVGGCHGEAAANAAPATTAGL